jgi:hypothetical protein
MNPDRTSIKDITWSKEAVNNVLFGCVLNIKLYQSGICPKLLIDMGPSDLAEYTALIGELLDEQRNF